MVIRMLEMTYFVFLIIENANITKLDQKTFYLSKLSHLNEIYIFPVPILNKAK